LLDEFAAVFETHIIMPEEGRYAAALWILHTYVFTAAMITPRLLIKSPQKRSGKTNLMTLLGAVVSRALVVANISASSVYRTVEEGRPTLLIDEADTFLPTNEELRGVLNAGYMRGGQVIRAVGEDYEPRVFSCWCPVAIATIKSLADTIEDRSVAILLARRRKSEKVERLRVDRLMLLAPLASKAQRWADDHFAALETADPEVPNELNDRAADCWRILLAIADVAGGEWPERARQASVALALANADIETHLTRLLGDLRDIFDDADKSKGDELFSVEICRNLAQLEHRPWAEWGKQKKPITPVQMARLLAPLEIRPGDVYRIVAPGKPPHHAKGYKRSQFDDAFERLPVMRCTRTRIRTSHLPPSEPCSRVELSKHWCFCISDPCGDTCPTRIRSRKSPVKSSSYTATRIKQRGERERDPRSAPTPPDAEMTHLVVTHQHRSFPDFPPPDTSKSQT
jgi:hypothetical protein